ncbi:hypothetical protein FE257_005264 [Aspergillus nanangensis]|uniref:Uncharacterized protein n=1 Tax=Aspergillus nanangensis TaxID=2582783 RepID=A0AAD4CRB2_ASPNN|nr:hypothetical protein FE257_005264 [Aspergillus nanangensis]
MARKRIVEVSSPPVRPNTRSRILAAQPPPNTSPVTSASILQPSYTITPLPTAISSRGNGQIRQSAKRSASDQETGQAAPAKKQKKTVRFEDDVEFEAVKKAKKQNKSTEVEGDSPSGDEGESPAHSAAFAATPYGPKPPVEESVLTDEFFGDIGRTIAQVFPFEQFAQEHGCNISTITQAVTATAIAPLSDPSFYWQDDCTITIAQYGMMMMESWRQHYMYALETNLNSSNGGSDDSGDGSSKTSETRSTASASSDDYSSDSEGTGHATPPHYTRDYSATNTSFGSDNEKMNRSGNGIHSSESQGVTDYPRATTEQPDTFDNSNDHSAGNDQIIYYESHDQYDAGETHDMQPHMAGGMCVSSVDRTSYERGEAEPKAEKTNKRTHSKWAPPTQPATRQWVYRDEFGNFVPIPTWEELEAQEQEGQRQRDRAEIRNRRSRGTGLSGTQNLASVNEKEEWEQPLQDFDDGEELDDYEFLQTINFGTRTDDGGYILPTPNNSFAFDPRLFSDGQFSSEI